MSDLAEKLEAQAVAAPGGARQTLLQLRCSWGSIEVVEGTPEQPERVIRRSMGDTVAWRRVSGRGSAAVFESESKREG